MILFPSQSRCSVVPLLRALTWGLVVSLEGLCRKGRGVDGDPNYELRGPHSPLRECRADGGVLDRSGPTNPGRMSESSQSQMVTDASRPTAIMRDFSLATIDERRN